MELQKIVQRIINLNIAKPDEIAIIGKREYPEELPDLKYLNYDEISLIKENAFRVSILKDQNSLKRSNLNDVFRITSKYVLLVDPSYLGAIQKTEKFIGKIRSGDFGQIYKKSTRTSNDGEADTNKELNYAELVSEEIKKMATPPELTIFSKNGEIINNFDSLVKREKEGLDDSDKFLFNFALIQNLKKQIAEKEKIITDKVREIENLKKDLNILKNNLENLDKLFEDFRIRKNDEIKILKKELSSQIYEKKKKEMEIKKVKTEWEKEIKRIKKKMGKDIKKKTDEIEKLKKELVDLKKIREFEQKQYELELKQKEDSIKNLEKIKNEEIKKIEKNFNKKIKSYEKHRKKMIIKFSKELKQKEDSIKNLEKTIGDLKEKHRILVFENKKKVENLIKKHEAEKRNIIMKLGRTIKERKYELEKIRSRYKNELNEKTIEMKKLEEKKNEEIEKLRRELKTIKSSPIYKFLSKIKSFGHTVENNDA